MKDATPFSPCGRRWREAPDEGSAPQGAWQKGAVAPTPHPQPLSRKGRGEHAAAPPALGNLMTRQLIRNAMIVTGDGRTPPYPGDALIVGDVIAALGAVSTTEAQTADRVIDAGGRALSPGFVDTHNHGALGGTALAQSGLPIACELAILGGVTKRICGVDGLSPAPVAEAQRSQYAAQLKPLDGAIDGDMDMELGRRVPRLASRAFGHRHGALSRPFGGAPRRHGQRRPGRLRRRDRGDGRGRSARGAPDARPLDRPRLQPGRLFRRARDRRAGARVQRREARRALSPSALGERQHHRQRQGSDRGGGRGRRRLLQRALEDRRRPELRPHRRARRPACRRRLARPDHGEHVSLHGRVDDRRRHLSAGNAGGRTGGVSGGARGPRACARR